MAKLQKMEEPEPQQVSSTDSYVSMALGLAVVLVIGIFIYNFTTKRQPGTQTGSSDQAAQGQSNTNGNPPTTHSVAQGETLWSISEKYYKSGYNWVDIMKANNLSDANAIETGTSLTIPAVTPIVPQTGSVTEQAAVMDKPKESSYTVAKGDSLWSIALKQYGSGYKWVDIARANKLVNPDIIHTGNVLNLP